MVLVSTSEYFSLESNSLGNNYSNIQETEVDIWNILKNLNLKIPPVSPDAAAIETVTLELMMQSNEQLYQNSNQVSSSLNESDHDYLEFENIIENVDFDLQLYNYNDVFGEAEHHYDRDQDDEDCDYHEQELLNLQERQHYNPYTFTQTQDQADNLQRIVLIVFTTKWSNPCKIRKPFFEKISRVFGVDRLLVLNVDIDPKEGNEYNATFASSLDNERQLVGNLDNGNLLQPDFSFDNNSNGLENRTTNLLEFQDSNGDFLNLYLECGYQKLPCCLLLVDGIVVFVGDGVVVFVGDGCADRQMITPEKYFTPVELKRGIANIMKGLGALSNLHKLDTNINWPFPNEPPRNHIESIQVQHPIALAPGSKFACSIVLAKTEFAFSYGKPFLSNYQPDFSKCGDSPNWSNLVLNFTSSVRGRQFDRIGGVWIGGSEILRYTSAEPSGNPTTTWTTLVDITDFRKVFESPQPVVVSLDNIVDNMYTGIFNVTVTVDFHVGQGKSTPDIVIPLSASKDSYGWFRLPSSVKPSEPIFVPIPSLAQNTVKAVLKTYVSGHGDDEFWYGNGPDGIPGLFGGGPFKQVSFFINNQLIGLDWVFPTIYTGGLNPLLWRPVVAIGAYHVPEVELDITPFLPLLFSNNSLNSIGFNITTSANSYWFLDASLFLWCDEDLPKDHIFKGVYHGSNVPTHLPTTIVKGAIEEHLDILTTMNVEYKASGSIWQKTGWTHYSTFSQVSFTNWNNFTAGGNNNTINQTTAITKRVVVEKEDGEISTTTLNEKFPFLVALNATYAEFGAKFQFDASIVHGLEKSVSFVKNSPLLKDPVSWKTKLSIAQVANGMFGTIDPSKNFGTQVQSYNYRGIEKCYSRSIVVPKNRIMIDVQSNKCSKEITSLLTIQ